MGKSDDRKHDSGLEPAIHGREAVLSRTEIVESICNYIRENTSADLSLSSLEKNFRISRYSIQRYFMEIMGISPRKYVEECRIQLLKKNLRREEPVPQAIYKTGYNSQSWLYEDSTSKLGMMPASYRKEGDGARIRYLTASCSLGFLMVAETDRGICTLSMADTEEQLIRGLYDEFPKAEISRSQSVKKRLDAVLGYFDGQLLNLPVDIRGTDFQRRVWAAILSIPYGETRSYNEIAEKIGMPDSYRAVANACGANPVPLIVPCHRVIRKNGDLGGYGLGIERKKFLLEMEKKMAGKHHEE